MDSPKCPLCPHFTRQHNLDGDRKCRVRSLSGWSEKDQRYLRCTPCPCPGCPPGAESIADRCAHEFLPMSPHPNTCVQCGRTIVGRTR